MRRKGRFRIFATLAALLVLSDCPAPIYEARKLRAIKAESLRLAATHAVPAEGWLEISRVEWPPVIASLKPKMVILNRGGMHIFVVPFFDGGWGYDIPWRKENLGMLPGCYSDLGEGVYWHDPC